MRPVSVICHVVALARLGERWTQEQSRADAAREVGWNHGWCARMGAAGVAAFLGLDASACCRRRPRPGREIIGEICMGCCRDLVTVRQPRPAMHLHLHARRSKVRSGTWWPRFNWAELCLLQCKNSSCHCQCQARAHTHTPRTSSLCVVRLVGVAVGVRVSHRPAGRPVQPRLKLLVACNKRKG